MGCSKWWAIGLCLYVVLNSLPEAPELQAGTITLSVPDTCSAAGDSLWLPIYSTDLTDSMVFGYMIKVKYDSSFIAINDVSVEGSISEPWQFYAWNVLDGQDTLRIAAAGVQPLEGEGMLLKMKVMILESARQDSVTAVSIPEAMFNEGLPGVRTVNGGLAIPCPPSDAGNAGSREMPSAGSCSGTRGGRR